MKTFKEIEENRNQFPIHGADDGSEISGFLKLDRRKTSAQVLSNKHVAARKNDNGWFDLNLIDENGEHLLLHNALITLHSSSHVKGFRFSQTIFPNYIVLNSHLLSKKHAVSEIIFSLDRMRYFFHYEQIEHQFVDGQRADFAKFLKKSDGSIRKNTNGREAKKTTISCKPPIFTWCTTVQKYSNSRLGIASMKLGLPYKPRDWVGIIQHSPQTPLDELHSAGPSPSMTRWMRYGSGVDSFRK
jgi:hypothetical protein